MRILVLEAAARDQRVGVGQRLDDGVVGVALVAVLLEHALALEAGASLVKAPSASTVKGMVVSMPRAISLAWLAIQISKSSRPWPGAVCTKPVPSSSVT